MVAYVYAKEQFRPSFEVCYSLLFTSEIILKQLLTSGSVNFVKSSFQPSLWEISAHIFEPNGDKNKLDVLAWSLPAMCESLVAQLKMVVKNKWYNKIEGAKLHSG